MFFSKNKKINALKQVYLDAHECITDTLSGCSIVEDADYETAVFLYHLMLQRFYKDSIVDNLSNEIALLVSESCRNIKQSKTMKDRMRVYTEVSNGIYRPRGFWLLSDLSEKVYLSAKDCSMIAFGDFLVFPECSKDYCNCPVPIFDMFDLPPFVSLFMGDVYSMYESYLKGIGLK